VITIQGVCNPTPAKTAAGAAKGTSTSKTSANTACKTEITKTQFEKILAVVTTGNQQTAPAVRRNLAQAYVEFLTFSQAAHKAGIDQDPNFNELMRLLRLKTLADFYRRKLTQESQNPPASEIQGYYNQNLSKYEELKLSRIFIPAKNPGATGDKDDWEKKAAQEANDIHARAAKGEDLEKLQKEAYTALGLTMSPPGTSVGTRRRGMLASDEEKELFALKPGEVSKVEQQPAGYIIYKVESKQTMPMEQLKDEISRELSRQKMEARVKAITAAIHADFSDQYFGPATPAPVAGPPGRPPVAPPGLRMAPAAKTGPNAPGIVPPGATTAASTPAAPSSTNPASPGPAPSTPPK
jgi:hypothetical protein